MGALVSIIIPVYCRAELAIEAIDSALAQDYENIEIIIGDNCSPDGTYDKLLKKYGSNKKIQLFQNERNLGAVGNWERCLNRTRGEYIKILWSDDLMSSSFVSKAVEILEKDKDASFVYSPVYIFENTSDLKNMEKSKFQLCYTLKNKTGVYPGKDFIKATLSLSASVPVSPGCSLFRREKLKLITDIPNKIGYEHKKNGAGPDLLMFLEALAHGEKFGYIYEPCNFFRAHPGSISCSDNSIGEGYLTAKMYFLREHNLEKYWKYLNAGVISVANKKRICSRGNNVRALEKYYELNDPHINNHSIGGVLLYKIQNKWYALKVKREDNRK